MWRQSHGGFDLYWGSSEHLFRDQRASGGKQVMLLRPLRTDRREGRRRIARPFESRYALEQRYGDARPSSVLNAELILAFWTSIGFKPSDFMTTGMNEKRTAWLCRIFKQSDRPR
jgi:hypothetical protein